MPLDVMEFPAAWPAVDELVRRLYALGQPHRKIGWRRIPSNPINRTARIGGYIVGGLECTLVTFPDDSVARVYDSHAGRCYMG